jgi:hypothetical protein
MQFSLIQLNCHNVEFEKNVFKHLGGNGVTFGDATRKATMMQSCSYPFMAPLVKPDMNNFCIEINKSTTGMEANITKAKTVP